MTEVVGKHITEELFDYSILVADNDPLQSARAVVDDFRVGSSISTLHCVQPEQSIPLTRNKAVQNAAGDDIAFIDDDEFPTPTRLVTLFRACVRYGVDGVLGPVKPHYEVQPPKWVVRGRFHERPTYPTGFVIDWRKGRTGNVLLATRVFVSGEDPFRPEFVTGDDQDFFRRMIDRGYVFVWCDEAVVFESIPRVRWKRSFMLKRALLRGKVSLRHPSTGGWDILKSLIAIPAYSLALPFLLIGGQHMFMKYLVKLFDHSGRVLAFVKIDLINENYVTE